MKLQNPFTFLRDVAGIVISLSLCACGVVIWLGALAIRAVENMASKATEGK